MVSYMQDDRQIRIKGWGMEGQKKIRESKALVIGSNVLSQMLLVNLAGLGVGSIMVMDNKRVSREDKHNFLYQKEDSNNIHIGKKRCSLIIEMLKKINEDISLSYRHSMFREAWLKDFRPTIIFDATNNIVSKKEALSYCMKNNVRFINLCAEQYRGIITAFNPHDKSRLNESLLESIILSEFCNREQGPIASGVIAGLAAEELRKHEIDLAQNQSSDNPLKSGSGIIYNLYSKSRISLQYDEKINSFGYFKELNVLVVGAGAIANYVALNLSLLKVGDIDIVDDDIIKRHNLNRQFAFYDRIGEYKSEVLSARLKQFNPNVESNFINKKLGPEDEHLFSNGNKIGKYDIVFGCVDNLEARKIANRFCAENNIPYIDGGTTALTGQLAVYSPGKKRCIDCQMDLDQLIEEREEKKRQRIQETGNSCIEAEASVVIPNIIIGSSMVGEAIRVLYDSHKTSALGGIFKYNSFSKERIFLSPFRGYLKKCGCENGR